VSQAPFTHALLSWEGGVQAFSHDGQMSKISVNDSSIVDFVASKRRNPQAASNIASSTGLALSGDLL
jgi:hypothetical protein